MKIKEKSMSHKSKIENRGSNSWLTLFHIWPMDMGNHSIIKIETVRLIKYKMQS